MPLESSSEHDGLGLLLIAHCLKEAKGFTNAVEGGLKPDHLRGDAKTAWEFCYEIMKDGGTPVASEVGAKIGKALPEVMADVTVESLARSIRKRAMTDELKPVLSKSLKEIAEGDPDKAIEQILEAARIRAKFATSTKIWSYKSDYAERILDYKIREQCKDLTVVPTPWPTLNRETGGWNNGQLHTIAALTATGKSWAVCIIADHLRNQGRRPLVVSMEMNPKRLQIRMDAIRFKLPFRLMRDATLPKTLVEDWLTGVYADSEAGTSEDVTFIGKETVQTVAQIDMLWREYQWTDILVDGAYRLLGPKKTCDWSDQVAVIRELQFTAERQDIPWLVTTQMGDSTEKGKSFDNLKQSKWKIRYAKEWLIDPDVVLIMKQDADLRLARHMQIDIAKIRDGELEPKTFRIHWDPLEMNYSEVTTAEVKQELNNVVPF